MADLQVYVSSQNLDKQGLCEALPVSKERLLELKKIKEKSLNDKTIVQK